MASAASRFAGLRDDHEVSILIRLVEAVGRCRGVASRANTSMMIMRPPQHGQGGVLGSMAEPVGGAIVKMLWGERRGHGIMVAVQRLPMELTHVATFSF
jgi:hypothetical protein